MKSAPAFAISNLVLAIWITTFAGCAKIGDPQPPEVLVPKPAVDLTARQVANRILLAVSIPEQNTNGTRALTLGSVEVLRLAGERQDTAPLPEDVFLQHAQRIMSIPVNELGRYLSGGRLSIPDPAPIDPETFFTQGYRFAVRFINKKNQTAGLSNQVFVAPVAIPATPEGLAATVLSDRIQLTWKAPEKNADGSVPARIAGYNVYRTQDPKGQDPQAFPTDPLNPAPLSKPEFQDRGFEFDRTYYYTVTVIGSHQNPSAESLPAPQLPVTPKDTFAPEVPKNLFCGVQNNIVTLLWEPPGDTDLAGFRVYRKDEGSDARTLLQQELVTGFSFRDEKVTAGKKYEYSVVAVDKHGNASQPAIVQVEVQ